MSRLQAIIRAHQPGSDPIIPDGIEENPARRTTPEPGGKPEKAPQPGKPVETPEKVLEPV